MKIEAKIIADSRNEFGNRITTMQVTFPRFILAELNTHRMLSKNSASSRAIPFEKMVKSVEENPFIPIAWQKDHKGMQGIEYLDNDSVEIAKYNWLKAKENSVKIAKDLYNGEWNSKSYLEPSYNKGEGVTKQLCNRLLEPFMWHTVLITATEWENFFALRCPLYEDNSGNVFKSKKDYLDKHSLSGILSEDGFRSINKGQAEIHMMALAEAMWDAYNESTPKELKAGEWHIPFGDNFFSLSNSFKVKVATARCARVSYTVVGEEGKEANYENDLKLHDKLAESGHWSPFEHCAKAMSCYEYEENINGKIEYSVSNVIDNIDNTFKGWSGNFKGFIQYRKTFNNENIK